MERVVAKGDLVNQRKIRANHGSVHDLQALLTVARTESGTHAPPALVSRVRIPAFFLQALLTAARAESGTCQQIQRLIFPSSVLPLIIGRFSQ